MKQRFCRSERVGDLIQQVLARLLLQNMDDERFRLVTVTSVKMSRDLSYARVYVSVLDDDKNKINHTILALNRAAKFLRYQLAQEVKLRIVLELKFIYDDSTARGFHLSQLIDDAIKKAEDTED